MTVEGDASMPPPPLRERTGRSPPLLSVDIPHDVSEVVHRERSNVVTPSGGGPPLQPLPSPHHIAVADMESAYKFAPGSDKALRPTPMVISPPVSIISPRPVQAPPPAHARVYHTLPVVEYITPQARPQVVAPRPSPRYLPGYSPREGPLEGAAPFLNRTVLRPDSSYLSGYETSYARPVPCQWGSVTATVPTTSYAETRYSAAPNLWPATYSGPLPLATPTPPTPAMWPSSTTVSGGSYFPDADTRLTNYSGPELKVAYFQGSQFSQGPSVAPVAPPYDDGARTRRALSWHPGVSWQPQQHVTERTVIGEPWVQTRSYIKEPAFNELPIPSPHALYRGPPAPVTPSFPLPQSPSSPLPVEDGLYRTPPKQPSWLRPQPPSQPVAQPAASFAPPPRLSSSRVIEDPVNYRRQRSLSTPFY